MYGEGSPEASVLVIGDAPTAVEIVTQRPFTDRAGKVARKTFLKGNEEKVFITNILCCHPPSNRDPERSEVVLCALRLTALMAILKPKLIVAVGNIANATLADGVTVRGMYSALPVMVRPYQQFVTEATMYFFTHHPAYLCRCGGFDANGNPASRQGELIADHYEALRCVIAMA